MRKQHGLHNIVRVRQIAMEDAWPELRQQFLRNHLSFSYRQAYEIYQGEVYMQEVDGESFQTFEAAMLEYLQTGVSGLYACDAQESGSDVDINVYFELEGDLAAFTKNFIVLYKLSN